MRVPFVRVTLLKLSGWGDLRVTLLKLMLQVCLRSQSFETPYASALVRVTLLKLSGWGGLRVILLGFTLQVCLRSHSFEALSVP